MLQEILETWETQSEETREEVGNRKVDASGISIHLQYEPEGLALDPESLDEYYQALYDGVWQPRNTEGFDSPEDVRDFHVAVFDEVWEDISTALGNPDMKLRTRLRGSTTANEVHTYVRQNDGEIVRWTDDFGEEHNLSYVDEEAEGLHQVKEEAEHNVDFSSKKYDEKVRFEEVVEQNIEDVQEFVQYYDTLLMSEGETNTDFLGEQRRPDILKEILFDEEGVDDDFYVEEMELKIGKGQDSIVYTLEIRGGAYLGQDYEGEPDVVQYNDPILRSKTEVSLEDEKPINEAPQVVELREK